jgi:hypothetical protein
VCDFYAKLAWKREKNKRKSLFLQNLFLFVGVFLKKDVTLSSECAADAHKASIYYLTNQFF